MTTSKNALTEEKSENMLEYKEKSNTIIKTNNTTQEGRLNTYQVRFKQYRKNKAIKENSTSK